MIGPAIRGYGYSREIPRNFERTPASESMSSLSGAHDEIDLPPQPGGAPTAGGSGGKDSELLRRAQLGDRAAFGELVVRVQDRLFNSVLRLVGDSEEARELTQETFTRALLNIESFRNEAGPYTWLFRIAVNLAISQLRKVQRHRVFSLSQSSNHNGDRRVHAESDQAASLVSRMGGGNVESPDKIVEQRERDEQVLGALGRLDAEYRAVLVMRDIEGFDYQQMADILGLPLGTLKSRLFRARLALRDELKAYMK
jgi:RNA polymerase sigma-70 factor, ECF subfamily